jgi:hypothetical protein
MKGNAMAGIIISTSFELPGCGYAGYVGYIDREAGEANWHETHDDPDLELTEARHADLFGVEGWDREYADADKEKPDKEYDRFLDYMDRADAKGDTEDHSVRLFTAESNRIDGAAKENLKKAFAEAEKKGSPLWKSVISFETSFLRDCGIYSDATRDVDGQKLIEYGRAALMQLLKNEGFETALWCGEIHKNKAHYHIHFAFVDPDPSWKEGAGRCRAWTRDGAYKVKRAGEKDVYDKVYYRTGEKYQKGVIKNSSHEAAKSTFVRLATNGSDANKRIGDIMRNRITEGLKKQSIAESKFESAFKYLIDDLPQNKSLWKYNMNAMNPYRDRIDDIASEYIESYAKPDYEELLSLLERQEKYYEAAYGKRKPGANANKSFTETRLQDLRSRMGNTILKKALEYKRETENETNRDVPGRGNDDPDPDAGNRDAGAGDGGGRRPPDTDNRDTGAADRHGRHPPDAANRDAPTDGRHGNQSRGAEKRDAAAEGGNANDGNENKQPSPNIVRGRNTDFRILWARRQTNARLNANVIYSLKNLLKRDIQSAKNRAAYDRMMAYKRLQETEREV